MNLKTIRENKKLSQGELHRLSGVSQSHISRIESGEKHPTVNVALKLARALGVSIAELVGEIPAKKIS